MNSSHLLEYLESSKRKLNILEVLDLIHKLGISSDNIKFSPVFSIKTTNHLIENILIEKENIIIFINMPNLPSFFSNVRKKYNEAFRRDQFKIVDLIEKGTSVILHDYFYNLYPDFNDKLIKYCIDSNYLYCKSDTILTSVSKLINSLQYSLSDYNVLFVIKNDHVPKKASPYYLNHQSRILDSFLSGETTEFTKVTEIEIFIESFSKRNINKIKEIVSNNEIFLDMRKIISIKLKIKGSDYNLNSYLPITLGKSNLNCFSMEIL